MLDAPVSGGAAGAAAGTLTFMVGGKSEVLEDCRPVLEAMGKRIYHVGEHVGDGETVKAVNQLLVAVNMCAVAEGLVLAAKAGVDLKMLSEVVAHSSGDSWAFRNRASYMMEGDYDTGARSDLVVKDLGITFETAEQLQIPLLATSTARQIYQMAMAAGAWGRREMRA